MFSSSPRKGGEQMNSCTTGSYPFGLNMTDPRIRIYPPQNVCQKLGPRPAAREGPPAIYRPNPNKPDRTSPIAARAPVVYYHVDPGPRPAGQGSGKVAGKVLIVDQGIISVKLLI